MSFDRETRNILARTVTSCRRLLTDDVTEQMGGTYGLHSDGTELSIEKLTHLPPDKLAIAREFRELLNYYEAKESGNNKRLAAYNRIILETSFTFLNRLVALRMSEERKLIIESVVKGYASDGFRLFEQLSGGILGTSYETYCIYLECLFDEVALDLGILFDRSTPQSKIFPTENCLTAVLAEINKVELKELWKEDETIGWVYQYFNPQEERKAMRDASQAPRNSRELAVRNQFFTPRYVVEFLTDNTLGRTWYEMRQGETILKENCNYLVRRPNEIFLSKGEKAPTDYDNERELSQEELLKQPVYIEHRRKKDPRDIKVLDPACGSGHFLLYAFDLLEQIYLEAWVDQESPVSKATGKALHEEYETTGDLHRAIPELIVRWNLFGIDIDQRAVQIAALALWLRAQKSWLGSGLKSHDRPRISKSNIVTAEPMPGDDKMRQEFIETLQPRLLGQIVNVIFEKMKLAGEAGSLLKIEKEIAEVVRRAKEQWLKGPKLEQGRMFVDSNELKQGELEFDLSDVTDETFWGQAESLIFKALKSYSEGAESGSSLKRRMFKEDAAGGFAFIDLCRNMYDVVLMNPPYGDFSIRTFSYAKKAYSGFSANVYSAFWIRAIELSSSKIGALTSRTFMTLSQFSKLREKLLRGSLILSQLADLGPGVLDNATVDTTAVIMENKHYINRHNIIFYKIDTLEPKQDALLKAINSILNSSIVYICPLNHFQTFPGLRLLYWAPNSIKQLFHKSDRFEPDLGVVRPGLCSGNDFRFVRLWWEISSLNINNKWVGFAKGGDYERYYSDLPFLINWDDNGREIKEHAAIRVGSVSKWVFNEKFYFRAGITFPNSSALGFSARVLPSKTIISVKGQGIYTHRTCDYYFLLAILNSRLFHSFLKLINPGKDVQAGDIKIAPFGMPDKTSITQISEIILKIIKILRSLHSLDETSNVFAFAGNGSLELAYYANEIYELEIESEALLARAYKLSVKDIDHFVRTIEEQPSVNKMLKHSLSNIFNDGIFCANLISYAIGAFYGRWDVRIAIDSSLNLRVPDTFGFSPNCPPGMLRNLSGLPAEPGNIVSEEWLRARPDAGTLPPEGSVKSPIINDEDYPLRISWEGILVDDPGIDGGQPHREDIVGRVREVLGVIWQDKAGEIEEEACDLLGISDLRDYFRKPSGFFQDHLKRYSKSRRKAPIYWPLSTTSGSYTLWIYYHRLNDQTLYTAVNRYVEPKIDQLERAIDRIEAEFAGGKGTNQAGLKERQRKHSEFLTELKEFREELLRVAGLPYKPNLNDGVIINAAPLHKLFGLRSWAKDTAECWKKLEKGEYDWAHMAFTLWPERVKEKSKEDRSLAVAHDL